MKGRDAVVEMFRRQGVRYVFGNPGTTEFGLITSLKEQSEIQYILALQEGVALEMARAYANASGKTGVVNLHVAPGLGNAMGALYNAAMGKMPLVVTAGQQDTRMLIQEPLLSHDLVAMARPLTKWAVQIQHAEDIPVIMSRAFKTAQDPPRGPVFVSLPGNVLEDELKMELRPQGQYYRSARPDPAGLERASEILLKSKHPVVICGDGVAASRAVEELVGLAEFLGARVWNTLMVGALNFPMTHPQFRGILPADAGTIRMTLGKADAVLSVGANLFNDVFYDESYPLPEGSMLIQIGDCPWEMGKNLSADAGILCNPKAGIAELHCLMESTAGAEFRTLSEKRRQELAEQKIAEQAQAEAQERKRWDNTPISNVRLMMDIRDCLPENAIIYNEGVSAHMDVLSTLAFKRPGSLFGNHGGGIGQGLPGAIGVKLAHPENPVIALVGDGSAMYTIQSLWTAAYHHIPVIYVILANQSYRILKYNMARYLSVEKAQSSRPYAFMDFADPPLDFVGMAGSMGVAGKLVLGPEDIKPSLKQALSSGGPFLLEVRTDGKGPGE